MNRSSMDWKLERLAAATLAATIALATGCDARSQGAISPEERQIGRYQFVGKEKNEDGTIEYACLDTATGEIGYATIYQKTELIKLSNFDCSN